MQTQIGLQRSIDSVFRTHAWTQAWLDTWGNQVSSGIIDLGGRGNPLEMFYRIPHRFKRVIPANVVSLVGCGFGSLSTPRSEYNDITRLISAAGGVEALGSELNQANWNQLNLTDIVESSQENQDIKSLRSFYGWPEKVTKRELSYVISGISFNDYLSNLSKSKRLAIFNRRKRLKALGTLQRQRYDIENSEHFFDILNKFHIDRWKLPCYSKESIRFFKNFSKRLVDEGGTPIFDVIKVDGKPLSTLFDVIWKSRRYNLQMGFDSQQSKPLPLGYLHLGYAIEEALERKQTYDLLAGYGRRTDYKKKIATHEIPLISYAITRGYLSFFRTLQKFHIN